VWLSEKLHVGLLCLSLSAAAVLPFHFLARAPAGTGPWHLRMPATHDIAMHFDYMRSFARGLASGRLYPRWEEEANKGFGAPSTGFHPPGLYYLTSLVYVLVGDWGWTFLVTDLLLMLLSGLALYAYVRRRFSRTASAVAMTAYLVLPYHLIDLYERGALAECLTFVWMPLVWLCVEGLIEAESRGERVRHAAGLAAAYGAMLWSHPPTAFQFSVATALFAVGLALSRRRTRSLVILAGALVLGVGLSAAYLYPAVVEQGFVRNDLFRSRWAYADNYVGSSRPLEAPPEFWTLIQETWIFDGLALCAVAAPLLLRSVRRALPDSLARRALLWAAVGACVWVLMTRLAAPLEPLIPGLAMSSFPWRMLSVATLVLSLLLGAAVEASRSLALQAGGRGAAAAFTGAVAIVGVAGVLFSAWLVVAPDARALVFAPRPDRPRANKFWVLPRWAPEDVRTLPVWDRASLQGGGSLNIERWDPESRVLVEESPAAGRLTVRTFDFPGWTASLDGGPLPIERGSLGDIELSLPPGHHRVVLEFLATGPRRLGDVVSLASLVVLVSLVVLATRLKG
jgi:hypothetical protein